MTVVDARVGRTAVDHRIRWQVVAALRVRRRALAEARAWLALAVEREVLHRLSVEEVGGDLDKEADNGFLFAGVQYGSECFCGNVPPPGYVAPLYVSLAVSLCIYVTHRQASTGWIRAGATGSVRGTAVKFAVDIGG